MNLTVKRTLRIFALALLLILMFCLTAQAADAASYKRIALDEQDGPRVKVGDRYFWLEGDGQLISVNGGVVLYSGKSGTGAGKELFRIEDVSGYRRINEIMVTNGSKIYFAVGDAKNYIIYSCSADGTKLKQLAVLEPTESELETTYTPYFDMVSVYNGRLYAVRRSSMDPADDELFSIGLESGKLITHVKNCDVQWASGRGRYIYFKHHNGSGPSDTVLRVFDCKNKKSSAVTTTLGAGAIGTYDGKMYYHKTETGDDGIQQLKIYSCTFSGKEDKRLFTLKNGSYGFRNGSKIYCLGRSSDGPWATPYYYDIKTKKLVKISSDSYLSAQRSWKKAGAN